LKIKSITAPIRGRRIEMKKIKVILRGESFDNPVSPSGSYVDVNFEDVLLDRPWNPRGDISWEQMEELETLPGFQRISDTTNGSSIRFRGKLPPLENLLTKVKRFLGEVEFEVIDKGMSYHRTGICSDPDLPNHGKIL
jgi:hypothetical protein